METTDAVIGIRREIQIDIGKGYLDGISLSLFYLINNTKKSMICYTTRLKITRISRTVSELKREVLEVSSRKNRILLGHLRNPPLLRYCLKQGDFSLLHISDMAELQKKVAEAVRESGRNDETLKNKVELIGETYPPHNTKSITTKEFARIWTNPRSVISMSPATRHSK